MESTVSQAGGCLRAPRGRGWHVNKCMPDRRFSTAAGTVLLVYKLLSACHSHAVSDCRDAIDATCEVPPSYSHWWLELHLPAPQCVLSRRPRRLIASKSLAVVGLLWAGDALQRLASPLYPALMDCLTCVVTIFWSSTSERFVSPCHLLACTACCFFVLDSLSGDRRLYPD